MNGGKEEMKDFFFHWFLLVLILTIFLGLSLSYLAYLIFDDIED